MTDLPEVPAQRVIAVVRVLTAHTRLEDAAMAAQLCTAGFSARDGEMALALVPIALARPVLSRLGVFLPDTYLIQDRLDRWVERRLDGEAWYRAALRVAIASLERGFSPADNDDGILTRSDYEAAIARSPELSAVNAALEAGVAVKHSSLDPVRFQRVRLEEIT